jgi:hypothetical protein
VLLSVFQRTSKDVTSRCWSRCEHISMHVSQLHDCYCQAGAANSWLVTSSPECAPSRPHLNLVMRAESLSEYRWLHYDRICRCGPGFTDLPPHGHHIDTVHCDWKYDVTVTQIWDVSRLHRLRSFTRARPNKWEKCIHPMNSYQLLNNDSSMDSVN